MKTIIVLICLLFVGCASVTLKLPTGEEISYSRVGDQQIRGFEMVTKDGTKIKLKGQQSNAEALTEAIKIIGVLAK